MAKKKINKKIRDKCSVDIIECIHVSFNGKKNKGGDLPMLPSDDGVVGKFMRFCLDNNIFYLRIAGSSGPGIYSYCHEKRHKQQIVEFFEKEGIKVKLYTT